MPANSVAKNIKKFRNAKDISQEDLAKKLNVTRQAISSWENGKTQPDLDMLMALSKALEVEMTEIIYGHKQTDEYGISKKDRIKRSILLIAPFIILVLLIYSSQGYIHEQRISSFGGFWFILSIIIAFLIRPLIYVLGGSTILSLLATWKDISIRNYRARKYLLIFGASMIWAYLGIYLLGVFQIEAIQLIATWLLTNPAIFIITGLCLFFGLNGEKTELKKTIILISIITLFTIILFFLAIFRPIGM